MGGIAPDLGKCACGMKGNISNQTTGTWRGCRSYDVTSMDQPVTHRSNWWWDPQARRTDGVCCETGTRWSDIAPITGGTRP